MTQLAQLHSDNTVSSALVRIADALRELEETGQGSTLVFVPASTDEPIVIIQDGQVVHDYLGASPVEVLTGAMMQRALG